MKLSTRRLCRASIRARYGSRQCLPLGKDSDAMRPIKFRRAESNLLGVSWLVRWGSFFVHWLLLVLKCGFRDLSFRWFHESSQRNYFRNFFSLIVMVLAVLYLFPFRTSRIKSKKCMKVSGLEFVDEITWGFKVAFLISKANWRTKADFSDARRPWKRYKRRRTIYSNDDI